MLSWNQLIFTNISFNRVLSTSLMAFSLAKLLLETLETLWLLTEYLLCSLTRSLAIYITVPWLKGLITTTFNLGKEARVGWPSAIMRHTFVSFCGVCDLSWSLLDPLIHDWKWWLMGALWDPVDDPGYYAYWICIFNVTGFYMSSNNNHKLMVFSACSPFCFDLPLLIWSISWEQPIKNILI